MIVQLTGAVVRTEANSVILDVGGVGYQVFVPVSALSALPEPGVKTTLLTHLAARVQPDFDLALYGFLDPQELTVFKILIGVSGVGAKVGLAMISSFSVSELARAISTGDTKLITKAPGVGPKLAQRICTEIGDRMAALAFDQRTERAEATQRTAEENAAREDVIEALVGLGYGRPDARRAADRVLAAAPNRADAAGLIAAALQFLTGAKR
ncbi:MAG TPA: Holliday junction branch migration protein RuvA [Chthonomonadaceae bacterium]|nr:Holliday junction branch migration protein RuvA [Chthonomonadaceae bacterium]